MDEWRLALVEKGIRICRSKTEYIEYVFEGRDKKVDGTKKTMTISGVVIGKVESFKYLRYFVQRYGGFEMFVKYRIKCG